MNMNLPETVTMQVQTAETNEGTSIEHSIGMVHELAPDIARLQTLTVNVYFVGKPGAPSGSWVLVDTGFYASEGRIIKAAAQRFGPDSRPAAIILTHGHFDHIGSVRELAATWDVPVYAHPLELPYLTGRSEYPPADPGVGGGAMTAMSWLYPRGPIDLGDRVKAFPEDGSIPGMPEWRWIHTPGHTAGHTSLFRKQDRILIAGDAFVTVKSESLLAVIAQRQEVHGPPAYFTSDWDAARRSVGILSALQPWLVATGHGIPMRGERMQQELQTLASEFNEIAIPAHGRYIHLPAITDENGVVSLPPELEANSLPKALTGLGLFLAAGALLFGIFRRTRTRAEDVRLSVAEGNV